MMNAKRSSLQWASSLGLCLGLAFWPARGAGLDLPVEQLLYAESYQGESSYPTTPEVDRAGAVGLAGEARDATNSVVTG